MAREAIDRLQTNGVEAFVKKPILPYKLDKRVILEDIQSKSLKQLTESVLVILDRIQKNDVDREQAMLELAAHKYIIQLNVMDYNRRLG